MESKLKALKVAELKDILTKAGEKPAGKATKADLVKSILATPAALDAFAKEDGNAKSTAEEKAPAPAAAAPAPTAPVTTTATTAEPAPVDAPATADSASSTSAQLDDEAEKRKKRAERFGIPFVENPVVSETKRGRKGKGAAAGADKPAEDGEKLKTRADRFDTGKQPDAAPNASKKRKSPAPVDPEEEERRRKRAERFGIPVDDAKA